MKKLTTLLFLFFFLVEGITYAQSVRIDFIRYKQINYDIYNKEWQPWPVAWDESGAYAIIGSIYEDMYTVSLYGYDNSLIVTTTVTFDPEVSAKKRKSQSNSYLNCYTDSNEDQIWTNVVSLQSLIDNVNGWKQDNAQLYLWVFSVDQPYAFVLE